MRKLIILSTAAALAALLLIPAISMAAETTKDYGDLALNDWGTTSFADIWDLTQGDLTLSYTLDLSGVAAAGWNPVQVGLHEVGAPNLDPNYQGGWLQSRYAVAGSNPASANLNDMHILMKHGWLDDKYDATDPDTIVAPFWYGNNFCFWFDRDGVDPTQALQWNYIDGVTYNTGGVYDIVITYHAVDADTGTMFATVNCYDQGFYTSGSPLSAPPDIYPVGRSFSGDMTQLQVFAGRGGGGGTVTISDINVSGSLYWTDVAIDIIPCSSCNPIVMGIKYYVPVAVLSDASFDAATVDVASVQLAGSVPACSRLCDIDRDGDKDLLLFIPSWEMDLEKTSTSATLTADTTDGLHIKGSDSVKIIALPWWGS